MLLEYLQNNTKLTEVEIQALTQRLEKVSYKRKEIITQIGTVEKYLYFVEKGVQRSYFIQNDKEYTFQFSYQGSFSGVVDSFFLQQPSKFYLECLTSSELWRMTYRNFEELTQQFPKIATWRSAAAEQLLAQFIDKNMELMACDSKERYRRFMKRSPHVFQQIPQKYIASYLGMSPETFSILLNNTKL